MNDRCLRGFGPVGTNSRHPNQFITLDFSRMHVGSNSFRGTIVQHFLNRGEVEKYVEWLSMDGAMVTVRGLKECANINPSNAFVVFVQDMVDWARENSVRLVIQ